MREKFDIVIVGAGMVGASLARALNKSGYSIALIDAATESQLSRSLTSAHSVDDFEPRVSAITHASRDLLDQCDAWDRIPTSKKQPYRDMYVWDQQGTSSIDFSASELYQDQLGFIVENQSIIGALHSALKEQDNLNCLLGYRVLAVKSIKQPQNECNYRVSIQELGSDKGEVEIECSLLIAADGANSRVRQWLGLTTREWDYQHQAIVATIETEQSHQATAWQRFGEAGPVAMLPLSDGEDKQTYSSIVWSQLPERADELMQMSDEEFCQALTAETEATLGKVIKVSKRYAIPLKQRHAKRYIKQGVALIGDAAHSIHPLAGQGVNLGFKDVSSLSALLIEASEKEISADSMLYLKRFQRERQGDNLLMMAAMEGFKRLFAAPDPVSRWLRNTGLDFVNKQSVIKKQLAKHAMGLPVV